jgi:hypothetical protein
MLVTFDLDLNTVIAATFVTYVLYKTYCYASAKWTSLNERLTNIQNKYQRIERNFERVCLTADKVMTKADTYLDNQKQLYTVNVVKEYLTLFQQILKVSTDVSSLLQLSTPAFSANNIPFNFASTIPPTVFNQRTFFQPPQDDVSCSDCSCCVEKTEQTMRPTPTQSVKPEQPKKENARSSSSSSISSSSSKSSNNDKILEQFAILADHMFQQPKNTTPTTNTVNAANTADKKEPAKSDEYDEMNN